MTVHSAGEIPKVLRLIWNFLDKWKGDITMVKSFTLISNLLIGLSLLLSLRIEHDDSLLKNLLNKEILPEISSWLKIEALDDKVKDFLLGSQIFMNDVVKGAKKRHSFIQMGDWEMTLRNKSNRKILLNGTKKMMLIEKMVTVFQLVRLVSIILNMFTYIKDIYFVIYGIISDFTDKGQFQYLTNLKGPQEGNYLYTTQFLSLR